MHVCMYVCMHVCMCVCMCVCMYVCMYACICMCVCNGLILCVVGFCRFELGGATGRNGRRGAHQQSDDGYRGVRVVKAPPTSIVVIIIMSELNVLYTMSFWLHVGTFLSFFGFLL